MNNVKRIPGFPLAIWSALICVEEISMLRIKYWRLLQKDIRQIVTEQFFGVQARMGTCLHTINRPQAR